MIVKSGSEAKSNMQFEAHEGSAQKSDLRVLYIKMKNSF